MQYDQLQTTLKQLLDRVLADNQLDEEDKAQLVDLINDFIADPTPANIEAFALILEELGKSQEYLAALEMVEKYKEESQQAPVVDQPASVAPTV